MELKEIRDELLRRQTISTQNAERARESIDKIKEITEDFSDEKFNRIKPYCSAPVDPRTIDFSRLTTDKEYLIEVRNKFDLMVSEMSTALEKALKE